MTIAICASMTSINQIVNARKSLIKLGHEVIVPSFVDKILQGELPEERKETFDLKIKENLIRRYYHKIKGCNAVLAINIKKNGINNYIGGNAFLELGFGHVLGKKIYLLNPIPKISYADEIKAMQPIILYGDLSKIK